VHTQVLGQIFHRHPIDAGLARVLSNTLQCGPKVLAFACPLHQVAGSWALVEFGAALVGFGYVSNPQSQQTTLPPKATVSLRRTYDAPAINYSPPQQPGFGEQRGRLAAALLCSFDVLIVQANA
jgi:hypothetical protein